MSLADSRSTAREIARAFSEALEPALRPGADAPALSLARNAAQLLALEGLDRVLAACEQYVGQAWPPELAAAVERTRAVVVECQTVGSLEVFLKSDRKLAALAAPLLTPDDPDAESAPFGSLALSDVLDELPVANPEIVARVRLAASVAAALRAALEWLVGDAGPARPLRLAVEGSMLEVHCERVQMSGVGPASQVLAAIGANLGPASRESGAAWVIRVPTSAKRDTYLMLVQGGLRLALPWHAVLKLSMVPASEIDANLPGLDLPIAPTLVPLARRSSEHPVVLVGHGLKRAYVVADRLVWRLTAAHAGLPGEPLVPGLERAVETEEGDLYWLAEPGWLLESVKAPTPASLESLATAPATTPSAVLPHQVVTPEIVTTSRRRVLVADDSIAARVFVSRLFEQNGFDAHGVATAADLTEALAAGPWDLVCVDVELPDAAGVELLSFVRERVAADTALVALVRDAVDASAASTAGIGHQLHKPFNRDSVLRLLAEMGFAERTQP